MSTKTPTLTQQSDRATQKQEFARSFVLFVFGSLLEGLAERVYLSFVPVAPQSARGARHYLTDLWRDAPLAGALLHTVLALGLFVSPLVFFVSYRPLGALSSVQLSRWNQSLSQHRWYIVRLAYYGGRGHALVAILREPRARVQILGKAK